MRTLIASPLMVAVCGLTALAQLPTPEPPRGWKTTEGQDFQATLLSYDGTTAVFRMPAGQRVQAPLAKLSTADQEYLAAWLKKQPIKVVLPDVIGVETAQVKAEIVSEDPVNEKYLYRTNHFEFESQGKLTQSLLREVGRNFEATFELLKVLPWGIEPRPAQGDYFRARLLRDKASYYAAGGPVNSGGVYKSRDKLFMVPFESIGVKTVGKSYAKDDDFDTSTMVHELTHQMMHYWLDLLPQWVVEGSAEYTGTLPLRSGKFRVSAAKNGLKDYFEFLKKRALDGVPEPYPLEPLFKITNEEWANAMSEDPRGATRRLYFTSYLMVYYFMHLDGKGDAQRFVRYFREVGEARKAVETFGAEMAKFLKNPEVTVYPDGRYQYPRSLQPPAPPASIATPEARAAFQQKTLDILLDGRTPDALMKEIRSAYAKLAIRL